MSDRLAGCSCGKLVARTRGEPVRVSVCHCLACQKRTGSAFGAQARFPADCVEVRGQEREYVRTSESGHAARFRFCPDCGTTVCYQLDAVPGFISIPLGTFADPDFPAPRISTYETHRHAWLRLADDIEHVYQGSLRTCLRARGAQSAAGASAACLR